MSDSLTLWTVGAALAGGLGVLGFLVRNAFESTTKAIEGLGAKLDAMKTDISRGDGDRRELARDVVALTHRLDRLERELRSEGGA